MSKANWVCYLSDFIFCARVLDHAFLVLPAVQKVGIYLSSYKNFPPRQRPASFSVDQVIEKLEQSTKGK